MINIFQIYPIGETNPTPPPEKFRNTHHAKWRRTLKKHIQKIVIEAQRLCATKTGEGKAPVNYACVFSQSEAEYQELVSLACQLGKIVQDTAMGPVFHIALLPTVAGKLELLKIRRPDSRRKEMGDADFTVANYENFKKKYLGK